MDDMKEAIKKYWPYILGAVIALFLLMRRGGGSSDGGYYQAVASGNAAALAASQAQAQLDAQAQVLAENRRQFDAQMSLQSQALSSASTAEANLLNFQREMFQGQLALEQGKLVAAADAQARTLAVEREAIHMQGMVGALQAQGQMAGAVATGAAQMIGALYSPSVAAMEFAALENAATVNAAATVAGASFLAQSDVINSTTGTIAAVGNSLQAWGQIAPSIADMVSSRNQSKGPLENIAQTGANFASDYMAMRMSQSRAYSGGW